MAEYIDRKTAMTTPVLPKEYRQYQTDNLDDAYEQGWMDALDNLKNAPAVSVPQWISVKDRLPEDGEHVLIWYEYFRYGSYNRIFKTHEIAYQYGGHWTGASDSLGVDARVFAWMPLPEPPKGENDG